MLPTMASTWSRQCDSNVMVGEIASQLTTSHHLSHIFSGHHLFPSLLFSPGTCLPQAPLFPILFSSPGTSLPWSHLLLRLISSPSTSPPHLIYSPMFSLPPSRDAKTKGCRRRPCSSFTAVLFFDLHSFLHVFLEYFLCYFSY